MHAAWIGPQLYIPPGNPGTGVSFVLLWRPFYRWHAPGGSSTGAWPASGQGGSGPQCHEQGPRGAHVAVVNGGGRGNYVIAIEAGSMYVEFTHFLLKIQLKNEL